LISTAPFTAHPGMLTTVKLMCCMKRFSFEVMFEEASGIYVWRDQCYLCCVVNEEVCSRQVPWNGKPHSPNFVL